MNHQETETRERLEQLAAQEKEMRQEIVTLKASVQQERSMYDELRSLTKEARQLHEQESAELTAQIKDARQQISGWEVQITALLNWKERMDVCLNRVQQSEADSPEARSANDEIHMSLGALRHLMERLQASKPETAAVASASASVIAESTPAHRILKGSTAIADSEVKRNSTSQSEGKMNSKISRLRDELQREEDRLNFQRQNIRSLELRARSRPVMQPLLEGQAAQNGSAQEVVSHWAERLKRATLDEQGLLERIATLKDQIAGLCGDLKLHPAMVADGD